MASGRGAHPEDETLFAPSERPRLRAAVADLSWLRTRGYGDTASLTLVGDRYRLHRRQRNAVGRSACADATAAHRRARRRPLRALAGRWLEVDAFNVIITLEGAFGGAYSFVGRDGACRDVAGVQGTYHPVDHTRPAAAAVGDRARRAGLAGVIWRLDGPVSNAGRLKTRIAEARPPGLGWRIHVQDTVDDALVESPHPVASSDSVVLDQVRAWTALEREVIGALDLEPNLCDLRPPERPTGRVDPSRS